MFSSGHSFCRLISYILLFVFSSIILGISAAFIAKTESHFNLYYRSAVVLLCASIFTLLFLPVHLFFQRRVNTGLFISSIIGELTCLSVLSGIYLGGVTTLQDRFHNVAHCHGDIICRLIESLKAFSWFIWIVLVLLCINLLVGAHRQNTRLRQNQMGGGGRDVWGHSWGTVHEEVVDPGSSSRSATTGIGTGTKGIQNRESAFVEGTGGTTLGGGGTTGTHTQVGTTGGENMMAERSV